MVVPESSINNIMGGLESTGGVRLHNHKRKLKQRFDIVKKLGQGTYGKVQLGINKETGQEVAIKTIKKCKIETEADLIRIRREIQIMSSVHHPNIIHIYEVFENREKMVLVMEYAAGGELYDFLSERKVLAEEEARRIFRQIATAVYYCHKHQICHRDLKLENILLDENGNAKIADFGLSNVFDDSRLLGTFCGSPLYASPEIVKGTPYHGPEVDCWSLGVLLYTLVYGAMPFDGSNFKRLVRQISQGDYFEPKKASPASPLIRDMLNINPARRADVTAICSHWWIDAEQSEPCLELAEQLANQTPVRLDLLLCLAPSADADKMLVADQAPIAEGSDRPQRSQSLSSLATAQADFTPESASQPKRDSESRRSKRKEEGGKRKERSRSRRERSSSRSRRDDSTPEPESSSEKPKRKSVKSKKSKEASVVEEPKEEEMLQPKISEVEEDLGKSSETILAPQTPVDEVPKSKSPVPSDEVVIEEMPQEEPSISPPAAESTKPPSPVPPPSSKKEEPEKIIEKVEDKFPEEEKPTKPMERRKSKIFETAEKFNKISSAETQPKPPPKKMVLPGVKVSDAKKAYERRSSLASSTNFVRGSPSRKSLSGESSVSSVEDTKFSLASSVALNKLVENVERMSKLEDEREKEESIEKTEEVKTVMEQPNKSSPEKIIEVKREEVKDVATPEEERKKVKNAVIGNAITEGISGETKAATLPRRRTSRAEIKLAMPAAKAPEFRSEVEHMVGTPLALTTQRAEVKFPVAAAGPTPSPVSRPVARQGSSPREYIVPIQVEQEPTQTPPPTKPPPPPLAQRSITRTSSKSLSRQSTQDSDLSSSTSLGEPIRKSPREVIIPIAVEGGGYVTPSADTITRMSSLNESEDDLPRGFGLHSSRRHNRQLETADSVSSDEDDDNFEILTAENLFSTLLSRVRSLTQRLNTDDRQTAFPRLFNHHHSIFDIPPRRLAEARSFGRADSVPWRRSVSRDSSHLPRDGSVSRAGAPQRSGSLRSSGQEKPPPYRPNMARSCTESLRNQPGTEQTIVNQQDSELASPNETSQVTNDPRQTEQNIVRGIPTAEIVGSSIKQLSQSVSKPEKRSTRLPQSSPKIVQETKNENTSEVSSSSSALTQSVPRRNSLERPSYYNSLYKTGRYNGGMSTSLVLPSGGSQNGDIPAETSYPTMRNFNKPERLFSPPPRVDNVSTENCSTLPSKNFSKLNRFFSPPPPRIDNSSTETVTSSPTKNFRKLDRFLSPPPRVDNGDSSASEYDFHSIRPYSTIGRTLSYRSPAGKSYSVIRTVEKAKMDNELETKYSCSPTANIGKGTSVRGGERLSSRFLRPQSLYGASDSYQTGSVTDANAGLSLERKSAFVRKSPSYQRSISLFEGKKAEDYLQSSSVTPDKSVLGKFFSEKKQENESAKINEEAGDKSKARKMSRFLRPDFYDTPKEDSVYEKKEKVKNSSNGDIWKEKDKISGIRQKKSGKKSVQDDGKDRDNRLSIVDKAIKSLKESSLSKIDREPVMARESNLIKRAVSLEDVSLVPESRNRRATSLTPQTNYGQKRNPSKFDKTSPKKKADEFKKNVDHKLNKNIESLDSLSHKQDSVIKKLVRKISPNSFVKKNNNEETSKCNGTKKKIVSNEEASTCNGTKFENNTTEDSGVSSRLSRIAGLKRLEFTRPLPSVDSTPSMEESKVSGDLDDSSSFLSPTEDGSDTWSISSDYADARDFNTPATPEDSVSDRIRRKSFYSRFNQSKRRKPSHSTPQSPLSPLGGSRSRLPMFSKSMTSDFTKMNHSKPTRKTSNPEAPTGK